MDREEFNKMLKSMRRRCKNWNRMIEAWRKQNDITPDEEQALSDIELDLGIISRDISAYGRMKFDGRGF